MMFLVYLITERFCSSIDKSDRLAKAKPVTANYITWPIGVATLRIDIASALSLSANHLFAMIIYALRKIDDTEAIRNVPTRIGQKGDSLLVTEKKRNIAPMKEIKLATLSTLSAGYLSKR